MVKIPCFWVWKCGDASFDFSRNFLMVGGLVHLVRHKYLACGSPIFAPVKP